MSSPLFEMYGAGMQSTKKCHRSDLCFTLSSLRKDLHQVHKLRRLRLQDPGLQIPPHRIHLLLLSVTTLQWRREKFFSEI